MTAEAHKKLCEHFTTVWGTPGAFAVQVANQKFNQPEKDPWGLFSIQFGNEIPGQIGRGFRRQVGSVTLQVFIPEDGGTRIAAQARDVMAAGFVDAQLSISSSEGTGVIKFDTQISGPAPTGKRKAFDQWNIVVNFRLDKNLT